jgi:hypothetical protein
MFEKVLDNPENKKSACRRILDYLINTYVSKVGETYERLGSVPGCLSAASLGANSNPKLIKPASPTKP